jgi:transcription elongation factor Elf1
VRKLSGSSLFHEVAEIAARITEGDLEKADFTCPQCGYRPLVYSFAVSRPPKYALYIHCTNCGLLQHFLLASMPPNFRPDLILPYYQNLEDEAIRFAGNLSDTEQNPNNHTQ